MPPNTPYISSEDQQSRDPLLHLREMVSIILERIWIGLAVGALVFVIVWLNAKRQTPYFRSTASLIVEAQIPQLLNFQDIISFNTRNLEYFNTHIQALHSRKMMQRALEDSGLMNSPRWMPGVTNPVSRIDRALKMVRIEPVERSRMIDITVEYTDPEYAALLANALADAYIQQELDERMTANIQAVEWLRARSEEYREKLEEGLYELQDYREKTQSVSLEEDQNIVIAKLKALNNALTTAETERLTAEVQWNALKKQTETGIPLTENPTILNHPEVAAFSERLRQQQNKVDTLRQRYRPDFPDLKQALEEMSRLETQFEQRAQMIYRGIESRYRMLQEQEESLKNALQQQEKKSFELDRKLVRYNDLKRNVEADDEVYKAMIARMKEASLSGALPSELIRIAEQARPARAPFRPDIGRAAVRGVLLGIVCGLGMIFVVYSVDHRFRRAEEVERRLGLDVLSVIPQISGRTLKDRGMAAFLDADGVSSEAIRSLRAELNIKERMRSKKVLMVTSTHSKEGKSLVSSNLAISMAQDHRKILLIGADLRRPALHKIFESDQKDGLAEYLQQGGSWEDRVIESGVPGLDLLLSGNIPDNPSELLGTERFTTFIDSAKQKYDRLIIDATPMLGVSDGQVLLPQADGVLFVVRYGLTHSAAASLALKKINADEVDCLGAVINGVNLKSLANSYYYRHYANYSYETDDPSASSQQG